VIQGKRGGSIEDLKLRKTRRRNKRGPREQKGREGGLEELPGLILAVV
jgi:hypothetical protein